MTDSTAPSDYSAEAFGAALATLAAAEVQGEGLTPAKLNEIGRRAGEAIRDAARDRRELGLSEGRTRGSKRRSGPLSKPSGVRDVTEGGWSTSATWRALMYGRSGVAFRLPPREKTVSGERFVAA